MIDIEVKRSENVIILTPRSTITADDIKTCASTIDNYINEHDAVPSLVFHASENLHWANFEAIAAHFRLVKNHHNVVPKVAIVSNSSLLALARVFVDHFTRAKVRRFPENAVDDAVNWAAMEVDHPGGFIVIDGLPSDIIGIDARGLISAVDYHDTLEPLVDIKAKKHDKLKLLVMAGPYFDGYSTGGLWDDARFGFTHITTFSKMALVTDHEWLRHGAKLFGALMPTEVMVFGIEELDDAKVWIGA